MLAVALVLGVCNIPASAAELMPQNILFSITSDEIENAMEYSRETGTTKIPIHVDVSDQYTADILVTISEGNARASGTRNISLDGYFYLKSDGTKVTSYGLAGSFEYTCTSSSITGKTAYHNPVYGDWTGTCRIATSTVNGSATLTGYYDVYKPSGAKDNSCEMSITVNKNGTYSLSGTYADSNVS